MVYKYNFVNLHLCPLYADDLHPNKKPDICTKHCIIKFTENIQ